MHSCPLILKFRSHHIYCLEQRPHNLQIICLNALCDIVRSNRTAPSIAMTIDTALISDNKTFDHSFASCMHRCTWNMLNIQLQEISIGLGVEIHTVGILFFDLHKFSYVQSIHSLALRSKVKNLFKNRYFQKSKN